MNPERLLNIACTIHTVTEGTVDAYGDPTITTTTSETVCWIDRRSDQGSEAVGETNWQVNTLELYLPAGTAITGNDRVTVQELLYEVLGPPHEHIHPRTGDRVYVMARIRRAS